MVLFCRPVVCYCGVDFIAETADHLSCVINANHGTPSFLLFVVPDAAVLRGGVDLRIACVLGVLGGSGGAEIGFAIVPAVMIDVVDEEVARDVDDFAVHGYCQPLLQGRRPLAPDGVVRTVSPAGVPFVPAYAFVIVRIDDGELSLRDGDPAESVAVAQLSVPEQRQYGELFQPARYSDSDNELDDLGPPPSEWSEGNSKHQIRNTKQIQNPNFKCSKQSGHGHVPAVLNFEFRSFGIVYDLDIRI